MRLNDLGVAPAAVALTTAPAAAWTALHRGASARYRACGRFSYHLARGKLGRDPAFRTLLAEGAIRPRARVVDIGCGQALLASLLAECDVLAACGQWPSAWGPAPVGVRYTGIERMPSDMARATQALRALVTAPRLLCGDMRTTPIPPCDVVVLLDVLHYVDLGAQDELLVRVRQALAPGGRLLLRVADPGQRLRFRVSQWIDHIVMRARGNAASPLWCRPLLQWHIALQALGFQVRMQSMSQGTPFANTLLVCDLEDSAR